MDRFGDRDLQCGGIQLIRSGVGHAHFLPGGGRRGAVIPLELQVAAGGRYGKRSDGAFGDRRIGRLDLDDGLADRQGDDLGIDRAVRVLDAAAVLIAVMAGRRGQGVGGGLAAGCADVGPGVGRALAVLPLILQFLARSRDLELDGLAYRRVGIDGLLGDDGLIGHRQGDDFRFHAAGQVLDDAAVLIAVVARRRGQGVGLGSAVGGNVGPGIRRALPVLPLILQLAAGGFHGESGLFAGGDRDGSGLRGDRRLADADVLIHINGHVQGTGVGVARVEAVGERTRRRVHRDDAGARVQRIAAVGQRHEFQHALRHQGGQVE